MKLIIGILLLIIVLISIFMLINIFNFFINLPNEKAKEINCPEISESQKLIMYSTGYSIGPPYNSIVRSGAPAINRGFIKIDGITIFTVAVDPKIIPLHSVLWIDSLGLAMATDTGDSIKGDEIDICFSTMAEAMDWGKRKISITVLRKGK